MELRWWTVWFRQGQWRDYCGNVRPDNLARQGNLTTAPTEAGAMLLCSPLTGGTAARGPTRSCIVAHCPLVEMIISNPQRSNKSMPAAIWKLQTLSSFCSRAILSLLTTSTSAPRQPHVEQTLPSSLGHAETYVLSRRNLPLSAGQRHMHDSNPSWYLTETHPPLDGRESVPGSVARCCYNKSTHCLPTLDQFGKARGMADELAPPHGLRHEATRVMDCVHQSLRCDNVPYRIVSYQKEALHLYWECPLGSQV